ncbi:MAG: type II secretion system F family protein [Pseudonocardiales bacterium]|nr:type II secretion system F family protein [Pseudonocardiales bacterium]
MLVLTVVLIAASAAFAALFLAEVTPRRQAALTRRLAELEQTGGLTPEVLRRRRRQAQAQQLAGVIEALGVRAESGHKDVGALRLRLIQAGYPDARAVPLYLGLRIFLPMALGAGIFIILPSAGWPWLVAVIAACWCGVVGYVFPPVYIGLRLKARQKEMQKALPDALDLLVVCVEAGLALNQALVRVSEETERLSSVLADQLALVNLEIRAGTPRDEALRNLGDRTGLDDIKSLVAMLVQTDRFGTSIAQALRVHAETLRTKRRQRAEEAAAKTTIKLVFPLVLFIFPAMFVVILGPALIQILETLQNFKV